MRLETTFEVSQHAQGVDVHFFTRGVQSLLGFLHQVQSMRLGLLHDFLVANHLFGLLASLLDDALGFHLSCLWNLIALTHHTTGFPNLLGNPYTHFIHDRQQGALIDHHLVGQRHTLGMPEERLQAFNKVYEIDGELPPPMGYDEFLADGGCDIRRNERLD